MVKDLMLKKYYSPKGIIKNYDVTINEKTFMTKQFILI